MKYEVRYSIHFDKSSAHGKDESFEMTKLFYSRTTAEYFAASVNGVFEEVKED